MKIIWDKFKIVFKAILWGAAQNDPSVLFPEKPEKPENEIVLKNKSSTYRLSNSNLKPLFLAFIRIQN